MASVCALAAFTIVACIMAVVPLLLNYFLVHYNKKNPTVLAHGEAYECGFPSESQTRIPFDNRYYLMALLFILFDIDIAFLFPWASVVREAGIAGWSTMMVFLAILCVGLWYEWRVGALEWI